MEGAKWHFIPEYILRPQNQSFGGKSTPVGVNIFWFFRKANLLVKYDENQSTAVMTTRERMQIYIMKTKC